MNRKYAGSILCIICFLIIAPCCIAQHSEIDSLTKIISQKKDDTSKVELYNLLAMDYKSNDPDTAIYFAEEAAAISVRIDFVKGNADAGLAKGMAMINLGLYEPALKELNASVTQYRDLIKKAEGDPAKLKYQKSLARTINNIAVDYLKQGTYPKALDYFLQSLKIREEIKDSAGIAACYNNIGLNYEMQGNFDDALKYNQLSLQIKMKIGDKDGESATYNNMGKLYNDKGQFDKALGYFTSSLNLCEELNDQAGIAMNYNNMGNSYMGLRDYGAAIKNQYKSLAIRREINDVDGITSSYLNLALANYELKNFGQAKLFMDTAIGVANQTGSKEALRDAYTALCGIDSASGDAKGALAAYKMFIAYRDSLVNTESTKHTVQVQMQYDFDKKEAQGKSEQDKKDAVTRIIIYSISGGLLLVLTLAIFIFRSYRQKQKANIIISQQKEEVEKQKLIVETKQKEILDSIHYAKRIQQALLPNEKYISRYIKTK